MGGYPYYQIGVAYSADGRTFTRAPASDSPYARAGLVLEAGDSMPGVSAVADVVHWLPSAQNPLSTLWHPQRGMSAQPSVLWNPEKDTFEMWYTQDGEPGGSSLPADVPNLTAGFWYASSTDGVTWRTTYEDGRDFAWDPAFAQEGLGLFTGVEVVRRHGEYRLFYSGYGTLRMPQGWSAPGIWGLALATAR